MAEEQANVLADDVRAERVSVSAATVRESVARCEPVARLSTEAPGAMPALQGKHVDGTASRRVHWLAAVLIALAVAVIGARDITRGGVGWSDGANHLFDGIFLYEFAREMPLDEPMAWAEQFYLRHPSLGIVVYWPPGFAAIEAIVFAIFGVSLVAARCVVLGFAFGAGYVMFRLVRDLYGDATGLIAALLLVTCPFGERWMTDIMLEWPATFWILLAVWAHVRGATPRAKRWARCWQLLCGVSIAAAFLTKQTAGFILPMILLHALFSRDGRRWLSRLATLSGLALCGAVVVGYSFIARPYAGLASKLLTWEFDAIWYARHGVEIFGWIMIPAAFVGLIAGLSQGGRTRDASATTIEAADGSQRDDGNSAMCPAWLFVIWFVVWYAFSSAIEAKEARYLFFALPPVVVLAANGVIALGRMGRRDQYASWRVSLLASLLVFGQCVVAVANSRGRLPSYASAVDLLMERDDADLVLVDAVRDGQFVFDLYQHPDARGRIIPLRASKLLYARAARMKYGGELRVESETDIVALLDRLGIRYVVMESQAPRTNDATIDPAPRMLLRSLVSDSTRFVQRGAWPLACDDPDWDAVELRVYEYLACPPRTTNRITMPVPAMGREVEIKLPH